MLGHQIVGPILALAIIGLSVPQLSYGQPPISSPQSPKDPASDNGSQLSPIAQLTVPQSGPPQASSTASQQAVTAPQSSPASPAADAASAVYEVTVTELRWEGELPAELTHEEILLNSEQLLQSDKLKHLETIRLTVQDGQKSMVQIGRNVGVVSGQSGGNPRGPAARNVTYQSLGTLLNVLAHRQGEQVVLNLEYSRSYHVPAADDDLPPENVNLQVNSVLPVTLGKKALVANHMASSGMILVVVVR